MFDDYVTAPRHGVSVKFRQSLLLRDGTNARNEAKIMARSRWLSDSTMARKKGKLVARIPWLCDGTKARMEGELVALLSGNDQVHWAVETRPPYKCYLSANVVLKFIIQIILLIINLMLICIFNNITCHSTMQWIELPTFTIIYFFKLFSIELKHSGFKMLW